MIGDDGRMVAVVPSCEMLVVRLGLSRSPETWDYEGFLAEVRSAASAGDPHSGKG